MATLTDDAPISVQLERLAAEIAEAGKALSAAGKDQDWDYRNKAHRAAQLVVALTQNPDEVWFDQSVIMSEFPAIRLFMKWKAFENIPFEGSISYKELAEKCEVQESLLTRVAWMMVATGTLKEIGEDHVAHTPNSKVYCNFHPSGIMFQIMFDEALIPYSRQPDYFEKYGRKEPTTQDHNPFTFANGKPELKILEIMNEKPERMRAFMQSMNNLEQHLPITGMYDFSWVDKIAKEQAERILFVDVGGGKGQSIRAVSKENPELPGERFILQDRPDVIQEVKALDMEDLRGAQMMPHDFHTPQPVKGALIYWIRRCIHDYGDDDCAEMLKHLADAMAPDSKCLIVKQVMTNPPTQLVAYTDICMLNIGGKERTLKNFQNLASRAGLKFVKHWPSKTSAVSVVECEKV